MDNRFEHSLKQRKLRITTARQRVYKVLSESKRALSAKDIFEIIKDDSDVKTDQVSIYRNLSLFSEIGLAHKVQDGKYSVCNHNNDHHHLHIIASCKQCGSTYEISNHDKDTCEVTTRMCQLVDSFGSFSGVTFQGVCKSCSS